MNHCRKCDAPLTADAREGVCPKCLLEEALLGGEETSNAELTAAGYGTITTEIVPVGPFYYAEDYHQQYLSKVPNGYCGLGGTGVSCPIGLATAD